MHIKPADFVFFVSQSKENDLRIFLNELDLKLCNVIVYFLLLSCGVDTIAPELHL